MNIKIDVHKNNHTYAKLELLHKWKIPDSTKKEIKEFIEKARIGQVNEGKRLSERTLSKYLTLLKKTLEIINKQTSKITKEDVEKFDKKLSKKNLKSVADYRIIFQIFLRWKVGLEKAQKISGWLDVKTKKKTPDYLSEQEVDKLFKNCKNPSERFLITLLFDSGARAEEFLNIRYEDIQMPEQNQNFIKITLKEEYSKTKGRTISLYWKHSLNAVKDFLGERINEGIKTDEQVFNNQTYNAIRFFLARLGQKILNKKITPHLFRHSSATYYATRLNRQELCYRYGWAFSSDMPDVYISRAGMESRELDEKFKATEIEEIEKQMEQMKLLVDKHQKILEKLSNPENDLLDVEKTIEAGLK